MVNRSMRSCRCVDCGPVVEPATRDGKPVSLTEHWAFGYRRDGKEEGAVTSPSGVEVEDTHIREAREWIGRLVDGTEQGDGSEAEEDKDGAW